MKTLDTVNLIEIQSHRFRRNRQTGALRKMLWDVNIQPAQLVMPLFVISGNNTQRPVPSMPGVSQHSVDSCLKEAEKALNAGIKSVMLFGVPEAKDSLAQEASNPNGLVQQTTKALKTQFGDDLVVMTDTCLCEYTDHGHCGVVLNNEILNDPSIDLLRQAALSQAEAGADIICPSDMMDGRIAVIREALDSAGYEQTSIMAYAVKYASSFYGPFRDAAQSTPQFGNRKTYQMDYRRGEKEALHATHQAEADGADIIMVKPAMAYLDILKSVSDQTLLPVAAYQVSGEYAMIKAAAQNGWIDGEAVMMESLYAIRRAGANLIITYAALEAAQILRR